MLTPDSPEVARWRAFPWDRETEAGALFSPGHVPQNQGSGRFDVSTGSFYLAESADHAIAEKIERYRGRTIGPRHLTEFGLPLALVELAIPPHVEERIVDLCDPENLQRHDIRPDQTVAWNVSTTQRIAQRLHEAGATGLRWWSAFFGEWHTVVLFGDRFRPGDLRFGPPTPLDIETPALIESAAAIGVRIDRIGSDLPVS